MKAQGAIVTGVLAVAGLAAAYATWQRPEQRGDTEAIVLDVDRAEIKSLRYEDARAVVEIVPDGEQAWVHYSEKPPPPPPARPDAGVAVAADGGVKPAPDAGAPAQAGTPLVQVAKKEAPRTRVYRGSDSALNLLESFAPLHAVRALGVLPEEKLEEVGLAETPRRLEVATSGGKHRFRISAEAQGLLSPYVMSEEDKEVYVLRGTLVSDLQYASSRLVDRKLHTFREDQFDKLEISAGGKTRTLVKAGQKLAPAADAPPDEFATNWHDRIWRTLGVDVMGRGEVPQTGAPEIEVKVTYLDEGEHKGFIELGRSGEDVYARTEHTAGWVRLHAGAKQMLEEAARVVEP